MCVCANLVPTPWSSGARVATWWQASPLPQEFQHNRAGPSTNRDGYRTLRLIQCTSVQHQRRGGQQQRVRLPVSKVVQTGKRRCRECRSRLVGRKRNYQCCRVINLVGSLVMATYSLPVTPLHGFATTPDTSHTACLRASWLQLPQHRTHAERGVWASQRWRVLKF